MPFSEMPAIFPRKRVTYHARAAHQGSAVFAGVDIMPGMHFQKGNNFSISIQVREFPSEIDYSLQAFSEKRQNHHALQETSGPPARKLTDPIWHQLDVHYESPK